MGQSDSAVPCVLQAGLAGRLSARKQRKSQKQKSREAEGPRRNLEEEQWTSSSQNHRIF